MLFTRSMVATEEWLVRLRTLWLSGELAPVFAGESLPTKLKARKPEYLDALQGADKGNLATLEQLVLECFESQFDDLARKPLRRK